MPLENLVALVALVALTLYAVLAGADFGGGVWDLLARGSRAGDHRRAISKAMGPVWEANHVWLIFIIVLLFSCFPPAFAALSVALFLPFHLVLVGIVLRGAAFVFRAAQGTNPDRPESLWTHVFGMASVVTPFLLGMCLGAISSGGLRVVGREVIALPLETWLTPFAWSLGALSLSICAYLAAVYLTLETTGPVREDFRRRGLWAGAVTGCLAGITLLVARANAPHFWTALTQDDAALVLTGGGVLGLLPMAALYFRRYHAARLSSAFQVAVVILGWALAQHPYMIYPDLSLTAAAAPAPTLRFFLWSLVPGGLLLIPSLWLLFRVFKSDPPTRA